MDGTEHLLLCIGEECTESVEPIAAILAALLRVSHRSSKALRFGLDEIQPGQEKTNGERLVAELNDLLGVAELLSEAGLLHGLYDREAIEAKKKKLAVFTAYSERLGTVASGIPK